MLGTNGSWTPLAAAPAAPPVRQHGLLFADERTLSRKGELRKQQASQIKLSGRLSPKNYIGNLLMLFLAAAGRWAAAEWRLSAASALLGLLIFLLSTVYYSHISQATGQVRASSPPPVCALGVLTEGGQSYQRVGRWGGHGENGCDLWPPSTSKAAPALPLAASRRHLVCERGCGRVGRASAQLLHGEPAPAGLPAGHAAGLLPGVGGEAPSCRPGLNLGCETACSLPLNTSGGRTPQTWLAGPAFQLHTPPYPKSSASLLVAAFLNEAASPCFPTAGGARYPGGLRAGGAVRGVAADAGGGGGRGAGRGHAIGHAAAE